jgi:hypothetical protein
VRAGVVEILALEVDVAGAVVLGEALGEVQRVSAADVVLEDALELGLWGKGGGRAGGDDAVSTYYRFVSRDYI